MSTQQTERPDEEQLRAAYEAELSRITSVDMVLQSAASLLNIGAHRLGLTRAPEAQAAGAPAQGDLDQVRDAIDAVRGLLPVIERSAAAELRPLRDALAQLQMAYSRAVQAAPAGAPSEQQAPPTSGTAPSAPPAPSDPTTPSAPPASSTPPPADPSPTGADDKRGPGPAESSGRLWVPGR